MALGEGTLLQLVLQLTWTCLSTFAQWYKHSIFTKVLSSQDIVEQLLSSTPLIFAPGLFEVLESSTPPTVSYFKSLPLPTNCKKLWAVYLLVLEKPNCRPRIYIGSATSVRNGLYARFHQYDTGVAIPKYVQQALNDGYLIVHRGLLCSTTLPSAAAVPILRLLFVALEAAFTFVFWAISCKSEFGHGMAHVCKWGIDAVDYDGLCSHNPLWERPSGDHSLSAEELEAQAADLLDCRTRYIREWREKKKNENSEEYHAKANRNRKRFVENNPVAVKEALDRCKKKAVAEKTHYCAVCDHAFTKKAKLTKHLAGPKHAEKVAIAEGRARRKPYHCKVCNTGFMRKENLTEHKGTKKHLANVAALSSSKLD